MASVEKIETKSVLVTDESREKIPPAEEQRFVATALAKISQIKESFEDKEVIELIKLIHFFFLSMKEKSIQAKVPDVRKLLICMDAMPVLTARSTGNEILGLQTSVGMALEVLVEENAKEIEYDEPLILSVVGLHAVLCHVIALSSNASVTFAAQNALNDIFGRNNSFSVLLSAFHKKILSTTLSRKSLLPSIIGVYVDRVVDKPEISNLKYDVVLQGFVKFIRLTNK